MLDIKEALPGTGSKTTLLRSLMEGLAGWSEVSDYHGLAAFSKSIARGNFLFSAILSALYRPLSGDCPWVWRTELI